MKAAWRTLGTERRVDDLAAFVRETAKDGDVVHIGTDSLQTERRTQFVTVLVIHRPGKGGRVVYQREVVPRIKSLRDRLMKEAWRSVSVALELPGVSPLEIHIDANPEERHASSRYVQELVGMVVGQGFRYRVKPDAWAASHAADHIVRHNGRLPRDGAQPALNAGAA